MSVKRLIPFSICAAVLFLGCGRGTPGAYGVDAAKAANQTAAAAIRQAQQAGDFSGTSTHNSSTCDASQHNLAWCENSVVVVWCDAGTWRAVPCSRLGEGTKCALTPDNSITCE
jgi:hypothetical protein